jgi:hypothetical protein
MLLANLKRNLGHKPNSLKTFSKQRSRGLLCALQGNCQRIAIAAISQHELALVVGAPQIIGLIAGR